MLIARVVVWALLAAGMQGGLAGPSPSSSGPLWLRNAHTGEQTRIRPFGRYGRLEPLGWRQLNRLFRSRRTGQRRTIHPRLVRTLARIQHHFGGRRIELVSGYRVRGIGANPTSFHSVGRAADIYIVGVDKRALFDLCRTLQRSQPLGCGYYPNARSVHIDVRDRSGIWVDLSRPGQPAHYAPNPRQWLRIHAE